MPASRVISANRNGLDSVCFEIIDGVTMTPLMRSPSTGAAFALAGVPAVVAGTTASGGPSVVPPVPDVAAPGPGSLDELQPPTCTRRAMTATTRTRSACFFDDDRMKNPRGGADPRE